MKVAIITDTHFGVRNDNLAFLDMNKKFLDNVFFPVIRKNDITRIIHGGDLVDRRKYINIQTANRLRKDFIEPIVSMGITYDQILGNHDVYYKNTNEVNAVNEVYRDMFNVYENPAEVDIDGLKILFLPWINMLNRDASLEAIAKSNAKVCIGHLEIVGFEMHRGTVATHGEDRRLFERFHSVFSGHFHRRSSDGCIHYLGSHGQFTWSDYGDDRGAYIFDTNTLELEFIPNPYSMFSKVFYDDSGKTWEEVIERDLSYIKGTYVKVVVKNKENPYWFDTFCNAIDKMGVIDMQIVEDHHNLNLENVDDIVNEAESTIDIFRKYIDQINTGVNKDKLQKTMFDLYNQASALS